MRLLSRLDFIFLLAIPAVSLLFGCKAEPKTIILKKADTKAVADVVVRKEVRSLAFGSCAQAEKPMPVLDVAIQQNPDLFIWLGDNVYGDSQDISILKKAYQTLGENPFFQRLDSATRLLATWDDHDYGWNDAGRHYPLKEASKEVFLDFWDDPSDAPRRQREGIYTSYLFDGGKQDVIVILLDTRTFRDDLVRSQSILLEGSQGFTYMADYEPHRNLDSTLLGSEQWRWLKKQLEVEADYRVIASSTQFGVEWNGYESWSNFPSEQRKMLQLLQEANQKKSRQIPTVFISGDVHYSEISKLPKLEGGADLNLYDVTASGVTSVWDFATKNSNRVAGPIMENNVGILQLGRPGKAQISAEIWDVSGQLRIEHSVLP
ncbi:alkaline phosphatase family protein [Flavobacteriales bacterium]|nr:alkaline phosphatase family protein [Flavobacteriales bacterium]